MRHQAPRALALLALLHGLADGLMHGGRAAGEEDEAEAGESTKVLLSSRDGARLLKKEVLAKEARTVLVLGGTEPMREWWMEGLAPVHAAMGKYYEDIVGAKNVSAQVIHWEPCDMSSLRPSPFGRWALDAVLLAGDACIPEKRRSKFAFEVDRVLRPGGTFVVAGAGGDKMAKIVQKILGWRTTNSTFHKGLTLAWSSRPTMAQQRLYGVSPEQCTLGAERDFCNVPEHVPDNCVLDPKADCPHLYNKVRSGMSKVTMFAHKSEFWQRDTYLECTLPQAYKEISSPFWKRYLTDNGKKRSEWSCGFEHQGILQGTGFVPEKGECKVSQNCAAPKDGEVTEERGHPVVRVLDAGGGSCSLQQHWRENLEGTFPQYKRVALLAFDIFKNCAFGYVCGERGVPAMTQSWAERLAVPDGSMDMVFQAQGLHHVGDNETLIRQVLDNLARPLRPGGLLHISDDNTPKFTERWWAVLPKWASKKKYAQLRKEDCEGHLHFLLRKPE